MPNNHEVSKETTDESIETPWDGLVEIDDKPDDYDITESDLNDDIWNEQPQRKTALSRLIHGKYDAEERKRMDRISAEAENWDMDSAAEQHIGRRPSTLRMLGRLALDRIGIHLAKIEKKRDLEARARIVQEEKIEIRRREHEQVAEKARLEFAKAVAAASEQVAKEMNEQEELRKEMSRGHDSVRNDNIERLRRQRAQELLERGLNERLLTIDRLEEEVMAENPEVEKSTIEYEGKEIPVYTLKGLPFRMLSTTIDFKKNAGPKGIGFETYQKVMADPSFWAQSRSEAEQDEGFGQSEKPNGRGTSICTSYCNSEKNVGSSVDGELIYGFSKVEGDSIVIIRNSDGGTNNMDGDRETRIYRQDMLDDLDGPGGTGSHNEILIRRYSPEGKAKLPNYIICHNGKISEAAKRHAAYYGIPIINIEDSAYERKAGDVGDEIFGSISEDDSYKEIVDKIQKLRELSRYKSVMILKNSVGDFGDWRRPFLMDSDEEKCKDVADLELRKRIDFIKRILEEGAIALEKATAEGRLGAEIPESCKDLGIQIRKKGERPKDRDELRISFTTKDGKYSSSLTICDAGRANPFEALSPQDKEDLERADSSQFDDMMRYVQRYQEALARNRESQQQP